MHATTHASGIAPDSTLLHPKAPGFFSGHRKHVQCRQNLSPFLFFVWIRLAASHSLRSRKDLVMKQQHFLMVFTKRDTWISCSRAVVFSCCRLNVKKQGRTFFYSIGCVNLKPKMNVMRMCQSQTKDERFSLNTSYITGLDMCKVCTEAVHCGAL